MRKQRHALHQETLIIIGVALLVGLGVPAYLLLHSGDPDSIVITNVPISAVEVPFIPLIEGRQSVVARRVNYIITSPDQFNELWSVVNASGTPPKIDFKTQAVIAIFAGNESSSSIAIAKIEDSTARMVSIALTKPDCTTPPSLTSPYEIVAVPATELPLTHADITETVECSK